MQFIEGSSPPEPEFVSRQTVEARRFYLDLNPPANSPLVVVCGGVERMSADYVVSRQDFPFYAIEWVDEGAGRLTVGDTDYPLSPGAVFAYGPGIPHRIENTPPGRMRKHYLDFVGTDAVLLLQAAGLLEGRPVLVSHLIELSGLLESIDHESREDSPLAREICASLARVLLLKIRQRRVLEGTQLTPAYRTYEVARQYIERHYLTTFSAEEVAKACGITPIHLSRLFNRFSGMGAYRFLLRLRMNRAAGMLMNEGMLVKDVATTLGYGDPFQFSRAFKRVYGIPPNRVILSRMVGSLDAPRS